MKCPGCGNKMIINNKGVLACTVCSNLKKEVTLKPIVYNSFKAYKVEKALNLLVDNFLLEEEVQELINKGIKIKMEA